MNSPVITWSNPYGDVRKVEVSREYRRLTFNLTTKDSDEPVEFSLNRRDLVGLLELFEAQD